MLTYMVNFSFKALLTAAWLFMNLIAMPALGFVDVTEVAEVSEIKEVEDFKYLRYAPKNFSQNAHTFIFIPGGPGESASTLSVESFAISKKASDSQFIFIDPPGTGLNYLMGEKNLQRLSTHWTVENVVRVLKKEGLRNYSVWGSSYGTVVATVLAHEIEKDSSLPIARAVILEGTLGKAFRAQPNYFDGFNFRMKDFFSHLPPKTHEFLKEYQKIEKDSRRRQETLVEIVSTYAYAPASIRYESVAMELAKRIDKVSSLEETDQFNPPLTSALSINDIEQGLRESHINRHILCRELVYSESEEDKKSFLEFLATDGILPPCAPGPKHDGLYDSSKYQITKTPVLYLQGFDDFQTPLPQALDHLNGQKSLVTGSSFSLIFNTNHQVFSQQFKGCLSSFLEDIDLNELGLPRMRACAERAKFKIKDYL